MTVEADPLIRARPICEALGGKCRRTLYAMVKRGDFPPPDRPARKRGEPDLWLQSTAERGIRAYIGGEQPTTQSHPAPEA